MCGAVCAGGRERKLRPGLTSRADTLCHRGRASSAERRARPQPCLCFPTCRGDDCGTGSQANLHRRTEHGAPSSGLVLLEP